MAKDVGLHVSHVKDIWIYSCAVYTCGHFSIYLNSINENNQVNFYISRTYPQPRLDGTNYEWIAKVKSVYDNGQL